VTHQRAKKNCLIPAGFAGDEGNINDEGTGRTGGRWLKERHPTQINRKEVRKEKLMGNEKDIGKS